MRIHCCVAPFFVVACFTGKMKQLPYKQIDPLHPDTQPKLVLFSLRAYIDSHVLWSGCIGIWYHVGPYTIRLAIRFFSATNWLDWKWEPNNRHTNSFVHIATMLILTGCLIGDSQCFENVIFIALFAFKQTNSIHLWFITTELFAKQNGLS